MSVLRQAAAVLFTQIPEIRSLAMTVDYYGELNDANIQKGLWLSDQGTVTAPDAIFGSMFQTLRILEEQYTRAIQFAVDLRDGVQQMSAERLKLHGEIAELQALKAALETGHAPDEIGQSGP